MCAATGQPNVGDMVWQLMHIRLSACVFPATRFNKVQQDAFLPSVENGTITLIGATTENPSFSCTSALLSRCRVVPLNRLDDAAIVSILKRAVTAYQEPSFGDALGGDLGLTVPSDLHSPHNVRTFRPAVWRGAG